MAKRWKVLAIAGDGHFRKQRIAWARRLVDAASFFRRAFRKST
jgi:hypothetical protein